MPKSMKKFWDAHGIKYPYEGVPPLFPLNEDVLSLILRLTKGNQRAIIKRLKQYLDDLIHEEMSIKELNDEIKEEIAKQSQADGQPEPQKDQQQLQKQEGIPEEDMSFNANPASLVGAMLKSIEYYSKEQKLTTELMFDQTF